MNSSEFSEPSSGPAPDREDLNLARKERLLRWLSRHWSGSRPCPVCTAVDWQIDDVGHLPTKSGPADRAQGYPLFPVTCQVCGYSFFINGIVAGVLSEEDAPPS
jgi:hypothetical protein